MAMTVSEHVMTVATSDFEEKVLQHDGAVLVDFWADWCGPCKMLSPVLNDVAKHFDGKLRIAKVNVDENQELSGLFRVQGIPAMFLIKDNKVLGGWVGYQTSAALITEIQRVLEEGEKGG